MIAAASAACNGNHSPDGRPGEPGPLRGHGTYGVDLPGHWRAPQPPDFAATGLNDATLALRELLAETGPSLLVIAESGAEMSRFRTAGHLSSWAGLCPGDNESAGK